MGFSIRWFLDCAPADNSLVRLIGMTIRMALLASSMSLVRDMDRTKSKHGDLFRLLIDIDTAHEKTQTGLGAVVEGREIWAPNPDLLSCCAFYGQLGFVRWVFDNTSVLADKNRLARVGRSLCEAAVEGNLDPDHIKILDLLFAHGLNPNDELSHSMQLVRLRLKPWLTVVQAAFDYGTQEHWGIVEKWLQHGANPHLLVSFGTQRFKDSELTDEKGNALEVLVLDPTNTPWPVLLRASYGDNFNKLSRYRDKFTLREMIETFHPHNEPELLALIDGCTIRADTNGSSGQSLLADTTLVNAPISKLSSPLEKTTSAPTQVAADQLDDGQPFQSNGDPTLRRIPAVTLFFICTSTRHHGAGSTPSLG